MLVQICLKEEIKDTKGVFRIEEKQTTQWPNEKSTKEPKYLKAK
jgi:hypothetical protein